MPERAARDPIYRRRRFSPETIELCVRWYITYRLSYRDLVAMMAEQGIFVSHTTVMRWVLRYVPEYERRWARCARLPGSSWPQKINVDGNSATHRGLRLLRDEDGRWRSVVVRARRHLNNVVEQDHRAIKQRCAPMLGLKSFRSAAITLAGIELAHRIRKQQYSLPMNTNGPACSLKELWAAALADSGAPKCRDDDQQSPMHQNFRTSRRRRRRRRRRRAIALRGDCSP